MAETGAAFQNALRGNDLAGACRLLSEETRNSLESASTRPCPVALAALKLPTGAVRSTEVWGGNGQIQLQSGTLFLAQFDTGWRITAAGCTPRPDRPYDCDLKG